MAKLIDLDERRKIKALIYGSPGAGKTRLACSSCLVPEMSPVLYLHASGNPESIVSFRNQEGFTAFPDMIEIEELHDVNAPYDWLYRGQPTNHPFPKHFGLEYGGDNPYKTVIVDQITDIQEIAFRKLLRQGDRQPGSFARKREWDDYNKVLYQSMEFADLFYGLKMHVILCAWEKAIDKDKYPGSPAIVPMMEGKAQVGVPGKANLVGRIQPVEAISRTLLGQIVKDLDQRGYMPPEHNVVFWRSNRQYLAKNQLSQKIGSYMPDPTMEEIFELLHS